MSEEKEINENEKKCVSCYALVAINLITFGFGHIARCPICGGLAYNGD